MKYGPYSAISVRIDNGILLLTLDRPEQLNTFTRAMMNERRPPVFRESVSSDMPRFFPWWKPRTYS